MKKSFDSEEINNFLKEVATIASGAKLMADGIQYVDSASFWKWFTDSYPNSSYLNSAEAMRNIIELQSEKLRGVASLLQGKQLEWTVFREFHPKFIDMNSLPKNTNSPIADVVSHNPFSGMDTNIQVKTSLYNAQSTARNLIENYPETTKFGVNQSVYDEAMKLGIDKDRFVKVIPDEELKSLSEQRISEASSGSAEIGLSLQGVAEQIISGVLIGAVISIGLTTLASYQKYKKGHISFEEFSLKILKEGSKGGLLGGSIAAINVGVQYGAVALGIGAPVTIPVMIIVGLGLRKIIDPLFGDGEYSDILDNVRYHTSLQEGWLYFAESSIALNNKQIRFENYAKKKLINGKLLNSISNEIDNKLNEELGKI